MALNRKIVVIGAGLAGLTAAHYLSKSGQEVVVLEQDNRPGGRLESIEADGGRIDTGAQFFHTNYHKTYELIREFGLEGEMEELGGHDMMVRDGREYLMKNTSIRMPVISLRSHFKMIPMILRMYLRKRDMQLENWRDLLDLDMTEISTYAGMKLNKEILDYPIYLILGTYSLSEPTGLSLAYFFRSFYMLLTTGLHAMKSGNDMLPKKMADRLSVEYESRVREIVLDDSNKIAGVKTDRGDFEATDVVSAVPSPELFPMYKKWNADQYDFLRNFKYVRAPVVTFEANLDKKADYYIAAFDPCAEQELLGATYPHKKFPGEMKAKYIQPFVLGNFGDRIFEMTDEEISETVRVDMQAVRPIEGASAKNATVTRHQYMFPQFHIGMMGKLIKFQENEGSPDGLYYAGDYMECGLIEGAVLSGWKAAQKILKKI